MALKPSKNFNPEEYRRLADIFPEVVMYSDPVLLTPNRYFYQIGKCDLAVPRGEGLEDIIKIGGNDQEINAGEKIQNTGFIVNVAAIRDDSLYHFDLVQDLTHPEYSIICHVRKRDGDNSQVLLDKIGFFAINPNQSIQQSQSIDQNVAQQL